MYFKRLSKIVSVIYVIFWLPNPAVAGPPLVIDDPGILDPGQWEIIAAANWNKSDGGKILELPIADISFGISENIQASAALAYVWVTPEGNSSQDDTGSPSVAVKWRFYNGEKLQMAVGPGYSFGLSANRSAIGIGDDHDVAFLPVTFEYALGGDWVLNAEVGYAAVRNDEDEWAYGAAISHPVPGNTTLFFELYGATDSEFDDNVLNFQVAADVELADKWHLLLAVGSGISEPSGAEKLDATAYVGIQYFTGM